MHTEVARPKTTPEPRVSSTPKIQTETKPLPGLWPVWLGVGITLMSLIEINAGVDGGGGWILAGVPLLAWGVYRRWVAPRKRQHVAAEAHASAMNNPERLKRMAAYADGSWFESVQHDETFLAKPCTWYTATPSNKIKERDEGVVHLTRKGFRLEGQLRSLKLPFSRIVSVNAKRDGLSIERTTGPHVLIALADPVEFATACQALMTAREAGKF